MLTVLKNNNHYVVSLKIKKNILFNKEKIEILDSFLSIISLKYAYHNFSSFFTRHSKTNIRTIIIEIKQLDVFF